MRGGAGGSTFTSDQEGPRTLAVRTPRVDTRQETGRPEWTPRDRRLGPQFGVLPSRVGVPRTNRQSRNRTCSYEVLERLIATCVPLCFNPTLLRTRTNKRDVVYLI